MLWLFGYMLEGGSGHAGECVGKGKKKPKFDNGENQE